jgi:hypothetical protein
MMHVYNVASTVVLNVEAESAEVAQRAADVYVARFTGGCIVTLIGADLEAPPFQAELGTLPDINAAHVLREEATP